MHSAAYIFFLQTHVVPKLNHVIIKLYYIPLRRRIEEHVRKILFFLATVFV